jgi:hypothetical protein
MASTTELRDKLVSARNSIKRAREEAQGVATRAINFSLATGTGGGLGLIDAKYGEVNAFGVKKARLPGTEVEIDAAIAAIGGLLGASGMAGEASDEITAVAGGAGAVAAWSYVYERAIKEK